MKKVMVLLMTALLAGSLPVTAVQTPENQLPSAPAPTAQIPPPAPPASATPTGPVLTLQEAETIALKNHPEVLSAQYAVLASQQEVREQLSAYYPTVYGSVTGSVADRGSRIGAGMITDSSLFNRFGSGITVDQLITDSGRTPNLVANSRLQARATEQNLQATRYDVLLAVNQAFFEVLRAEALQKVAQETVNERQVVTNQVTALVNNKLKSNLDLSFAQVNLAQAKLLLISAQNNVNKTRAQLTRAMGTDRAQTYTLQDSAMPEPPAPSADPLVTQALTDRPEMLAFTYNKDAAYKFEKAERDLSFPTVEGIGIAGYIPYIEQLTLPRAIPDHYEAAAVNVNIPIFNGHLYAARRTAALMQAKAADQNLRNEQEKITRDVRAAWADVTTSYQQIDVADQLVNQANLALTLAQGRYNLGLSSIVELTQAQLNSTQADIQDVNAKYDYQNQYAALQYQIGALR